MSDDETKKWIYQTILYERVLQHLGYQVANIANANKEVLLNGVVEKTPEQIIHDFQMKPPASGKGGEG